MYLDENACRFSVPRGTLTFVSPYFGTVVRLSPWEQPCRIMWLNSLWGNARLEEDFPLFTTDVLQHMPEHPVSRYAATLPPEVVAALVHYEVDQLSMLQVCAASPRGVQLLHSFPNLLWLVAPDMVRKSGGACDKIHEMLGRTHRDMLQLMEPAPDTVILELLAHVSPPRVPDDARARLFRVLKNSVYCDIVRCRPNMSWEMLGIMERYEGMHGMHGVRNILLEAKNARCLLEGVEYFSALYANALKFGHDLHIDNAQYHVLRCPSVAELQALHDRWAEALARVRCRHALHCLGGGL